MNRIKLVAILAVLGIGTYVVMSSIYTVSEVEQAIITQFGDPVVPLRDTLVTNAVRELDVASLVPTQKGRKLVEQEIFGEAAEKVRVFGIELLDIRFKRINRQNMSAAAAPFAESGHRAPRRWCRPTGPEGDEERRLSIQGCRDGPSSSSRR